MNEELKANLIQLGAKKWQSADKKHTRIYLNSNAQLEALGAKITSTPKYSGDTKGIGSKTKLFWNEEKELFECETGSLKNTITQLGYKATRI